jgi:preprotein translocase subunit YajC
VVAAAAAGLVAAGAAEGTAAGLVGAIVGVGAAQAITSIIINKKTTVPVKIRFKSFSLKKHWPDLLFGP